MTTTCTYKTNDLLTALRFPCRWYAKTHGSKADHENPGMQVLSYLIAGGRLLHDEVQIPAILEESVVACKKYSSDYANVATILQLLCEELQTSLAKTVNSNTVDNAIPQKIAVNIGMIEHKLEIPPIKSTDYNCNWFVETRRMLTDLDVLIEHYRS